MPYHNGIYTRFKASSLCSYIYKLLKTYASLLLSKISTCDLCGQKAERYSMLCNDCNHDMIKFNLPALDHDLLNWPAFYHAIEPITFDQLICVAPYQWPYSHWIRQLKYQGHFEIAALLSDLIFMAWELKNKSNTRIDSNEIHKIKENSPETAVISVPMHFQKWQKRGYNQAYLLAQRFSQKTKLPHLSRTVIRCKETVNQVGLTGVERRKNLKKAFVLSPEANLPPHIILIDDVLTTGSTANEITKILKENGVIKVTVLTLCLALPSHKMS